MQDQPQFQSRPLELLNLSQNFNEDIGNGLPAILMNASTLILVRNFN